MHQKKQKGVAGFHNATPSLALPCIVALDFLTALSRDAMMLCCSLYERLESDPPYLLEQNQR